MAGKLNFYGDEHIRRVIAEALIQKGYGFTLAADHGMTAKDDDTEHLPFATSLEAVIFTLDRPFAGRASQHADHAGLICWTGSIDDIGGMIDALIAFADSHTAEDVHGRVFWLKRP